MKSRVRVFVLGTGSSGNALIVESEGTRVMIDAGIGPRACAARLASLGASLLPRGVDAIVVTHHHGDHFAQAAKLARALRVPVHVHAGIDVARSRRKLDVRAYEPGRALRVGALEITAEEVPHDAPQVALRIASAAHAFGVATDVGRATAGLARLLASCDAALLEANHCPEMLARGPYPEHLKRRVAGGLGHLSNGRAAELARALIHTRLGRLYLGHLSRTNNTPARALETVAGAAPDLEVDVLRHGAVAELDLTRRRALQLALPFAVKAALAPASNRR